MFPTDALLMARRVFARMNAAEESVHGAHVHFHEVGADDAIADVIGACTALAALKVDEVAVLPVAVGSGTVTSAHGTMPVPAPATAEIPQKFRPCRHGRHRRRRALHPHRRRPPRGIFHHRPKGYRAVYHPCHRLWRRDKGSEGCAKRAPGHAR